MTAQLFELPSNNTEKHHGKPYRTRKTHLAFGGLTFSVLLIGGMAIKTLGDANDRFKHYVNGINARSNTAHLVREAIDLRAIAARNLVLVKKTEDVATEKEVVTKATLSE